MASKNLGAVIQRAISDGAFRRQLQSDPAAALRGFNLTSDEIAAVRSGDSSKLLSLGVDSRMSKAFALGATANSDATRKAMSGDLGGGTSSVNIADNTSGAREGLSSDQTTGARAAYSDGQTSGARATISDGGNSGAVHDSASASITTTQGDSYRAVNDPDGAGASRAMIGDPTQAGARSTLTGGNADAYRAINDPDGAGGLRNTVSAPQGDSYRAINDPDGAGGLRNTVSAPQGDSYRAINDPDGAGGLRNTVSAPQGDAYRAINDPDNTGGTHSVQTTGGDSGPGDANIMADDNNSVASRMHDANVSLPGSDVQHDPGFVDAHDAIVPDGTGDALGHTGDTGDEHSWG